MKIWYFPVAILSGLGAAFLIHIAGAPDWSCGIVSGVVTGFVTHMLLRHA